MGPRYDSAAWTGRTRAPYQFREMRLSRALRHRLAWWLVTGLKKTFCPHDWHWSSDTCEVCGLTAEARMDHSWRHFPRNIAVFV